MKRFMISVLLAAAGFFSCSQQGCNEKAGANTANLQSEIKPTPNQPYQLSDSFKNYWYAGKAELSSYKLNQARYGQIHDGSAVLIFVTEDFSKSKEVKLDHPENAGDDKLPVLKLNLTKKFVTGIYPYSMMMSAFSPVDINNYPHAAKTATSVQEWCGTTYTQINLRNNKFNVEWHSYFEDEGDQNLSFDVCWLEDELWNLIRIAPEKLPTGKQKILPGSLYTRMSHVPLQIQDANLTLNEKDGSEVYSIDYPSQQHTINITFEKNFPHKILSWNETFPGFDGKLLTTTATLDKTIITDYWRHNHDDDRAMREQLDLPKDFQ